MAYRAIRDTFGHEDHGNGIRIRRRVFAGSMIPGGLEVPAKDVEEVSSGGVMESAYGAALTAPVRPHLVEEPALDVKTASIAELRDEARRRNIDIEGGVDRARRDALLKALENAA